MRIFAITVGYGNPRLYHGMRMNRIPLSETSQAAVLLQIRDDEEWRKQLRWQLLDYKTGLPCSYSLSSAHILIGDILTDDTVVPQLMYLHRPPVLFRVFRPRVIGDGNSSYPLELQFHLSVGANRQWDKIGTLEEVAPHLFQQT